MVAREAWIQGRGGGPGWEEEEKGKGTRFSFFTGYTVPSYDAFSGAKTSAMIDI
jgi:hypothetical protein